MTIEKSHTVRSLNLRVLTAWRNRHNHPLADLTWTINGEPACVSELAVSPLYDPPNTCRPVTRQLAEAQAERVAALHPSAKIEIIEGPCELGGAR